MTAQPLGLGPRVAAFLREAYPRDRAKLIARRFRVSESTAERWLRGHAPTTDHIEEMYGEWGTAFVMAVFSEAFAARDPRVSELEAYRAQEARAVHRPRDVQPRPSLPTADHVECSARQVQASARQVWDPGRRLIGELLETVPPEPLHSRLLRLIRV